MDADEVAARQEIQDLSAEVLQMEAQQAQQQGGVLDTFFVTKYERISTLLSEKTKQLTELMKLKVLCKQMAILPSCSTSSSASA